MTDRRTRVLELRSVRGTGGGPEKTILLGAALANRAEVDVTVAYIRDVRDGVFALDHRASDLPIDYVEIRERHSFDRGIWRQLRQLVAERAIDIVHAHEYKTDLLALLLARYAGVIPLATAHGWTGQSARETYIYYPLDKRLLARFPRVLAVSTDIKNQIVAAGGDPSRIAVILNSIDPVAFQRVPGRREAVRDALGYGPAELVIGAVGRLEQQKRFDLLIEAFASCLRRHSSLRLAIVGDGSLRGALEASIVKFGVQSQCRLLGHRDDIRDLHHAFDLFVQSSEYEGTPNAVLEAMAMETPLVATDVGGTRELAFPDEHALIVPARDVAALERAIEAMVRHPDEARRRAAAARRRIETDLSFETRTRALERVYAELKSGRGRPIDRQARAHA